MLILKISKLCFSSSSKKIKLVQLFHHLLSLSPLRGVMFCQSSCNKSYVPLGERFRAPPRSSNPLNPQTPPHKCLVYVGDPLIHSDSWETSHSHPKSPLPQPKRWQQRGGQSWDKDPPPFKKKHKFLQWNVNLTACVITTTHFFTSLTSCLVISFFCQQLIFFFQ